MSTVRIFSRAYHTFSHVNTLKEGYGKKQCVNLVSVGKGCICRG